jgi:perosamine synthetase
MSSKLAVLGGDPAVPPGFAFRAWPAITRQEEVAIMTSLRQDNHLWGPNCEALEKEWALWNGNRFCAAVNSGTAALHMCVAACGIHPGDEVITSALGSLASAMSILHHNGVPVFVDVNWETMLMDPGKIEAAITPKTRAVMVQHHWGVPCDMDAIMVIARRNRLMVIEDCTSAHGATYKGRKVGTIGDCAAFSMRQDRNLSAGDGGLFVSDDPNRFAVARGMMTPGGVVTGDGEDSTDEGVIGWDYRLTDITASFARSSLGKLDLSNRRARTTWRKLNVGIKGIKGLLRAYDSQEQRGNAYAYVLRVDPTFVGYVGPASAFRDAVVDALRAEGVPCGPAKTFIPAHAVFQKQEGYGQGCPWTCPNSQPGVSYALAQYPIASRAAGVAIQLGMETHRPPNGTKQLDVLIAAVRKVFTNLDQIVVEQK